MAGIAYSGSTSIAITAASLASGAYRSSAAVTTGAAAIAAAGSAQNIIGIQLTIRILTTNTAASGNKQILVLGYWSEDGTNYLGNSGTTDNVDGTDKAITIGSPTNLRQWGAISMNQGANAVTATFVTDVVARLGTVPFKWGFVLGNDQGTAFGGTVTASYKELWYS